uniref:Uncharacterized protein n=1 Tax=Auxenochlorella protothecoides TaxID=3075 RepID=A0A1D1ZRU9_AUXPR
MARRALGRAWSLYISSPAAECSISGSTGCQSVRYSTAVEAKGLTQLKAFLREDSGKKISKTIRKGGRVPGVVFSLPQEQELLVSFAAKDIETQLLRLGRTGWGCHIFDVAVMNGDGKKMTHYPAVGRQVHITADTDVVENVTLIHCPPDRHVKVAVPIQIFGEEVCPGLKAGGRINHISRKVRVLARGDSIPESFELNVSALNVGDKLHFSDLVIPENVKLLEDVAAPALKIMRK